MDGKKAQHEIAGFVLIVLLVSVIGVVFLSLLFARGTTSEQKSFEISRLLESSMYTTSDCSVNYIYQYRDINDLIKECYATKKGNVRECLNGEEVCDVLQKDLKNILDSSLDVGDDSVNRGYNLNIYYSYGDTSNPNEQILTMGEGFFSNCTSIVGGGHSIAAGSFGFGIIETELKVCKG